MNGPLVRGLANFLLAWGGGVARWNGVVSLIALDDLRDNLRDRTSMIGSQETACVIRGLGSFYF